MKIWTRGFSEIRDRLLLCLNRHKVDAAILYPDSEQGTAVAVLKATAALIEGYPRLYMLGTVHVPSLSQQHLEELDEAQRFRDKTLPGI